MQESGTGPPPEAVRIDSEGVELAGHLYLPDGAGWGAVPGVVVCHGLGSAKDNHADFAHLLRAHGFAALAFDLRGHGESGGALDEGPVEDVLATVRYLAGRREVSPSRIALRGSSLGGQLAIHAAARSETVRAVVAICPAHESLMLGREDEPEFETAVAELERRIRFDRAGFSRYLREHRVAASAASLSPRPLLVIHCRGDEVVPFRLSERLHARAGTTAELWPVEGGSHTSAQHDPELQLRAIRWLEEHLQP
jgi:uncharacterized protein